MKTYLLILISAIFIVFFHYQSLPHASSCISLPLQEATQDNREMVQFSEKKIDVKQNYQKTLQTNLEKSDIKEKDTSSSKSKEASQQKESSPQSEVSSPTQSVQDKTSNTTIFTSHQLNLIKTTFIQLINQTRETPVVLSTSLSNSTSLRAQEAIIKWSHTRPNGSHWDTTLSSLISIKKVAHGENLAQATIKYKTNYTDNELIEMVHSLHQGLINSPTHYHVMTNVKYKKVNIGICTQLKDEQLLICIAQHFIA